MSGLLDDEMKRVVDPDVVVRKVLCALYIRLGEMMGREGKREGVVSVAHSCVRPTTSHAVVFLERELRVLRFAVEQVM